MAIVGQLEKIKIVPVLVLNSLDEGMAVCSDLYTHGLRAAEITFRTSAAEAVIREAGLRYPDMLLGAGTVLNVADLHRAFAAGAKFAVAPGFNSTVVKEARRCGFEFAPGVCTPSECEQAIEQGCTFLKFFPAEASGGTAMLKSLIAPYRHLGIRFMPTGGVKPENVRSYLDIPEVAAVGGTWLNKCLVEMIDSAAAIAREYAK
ncbi:MAG: bifunctional 4-hydroxy-2-oxoglutarate aldolase/2-dehydro-3-deoxy-phosphogluconate aldolase [Lentisphaeria bacterium]|nr:bifunctional 4-hydroxy-2-oxoglutarate aldolase/2-dehydro-3-deoxy-phosphogluconate aldolase [Lentisphaeria bacterium]